jgi:hypothetical protein
MKTAEKQEYTLEELISIFSEEASKTCRSPEEASVLAMDALVDFVNIYSDNVIIDGMSYPTHRNYLSASPLKIIQGG